MYRAIRRFVVPLVCSVVISSFGFAQELTLEEILYKHFDAVGGADKVSAVKTARMTGSMTMGPGMEVPITITFKRPLKVRLEFNVQGMTGIQAFNGEIAWMFMPFMGDDRPKVMDAEQAENLREQADFDGPLKDWKEKGHQLELAGKEEVDGTEVFKIKITLKTGNVRYFFIDSNSFLLIRQTGLMSFQGSEVEMESRMSDYRKVGDLNLPHSIENRRIGAQGSQTLSFQRIEIGVEVPNSLFELPQ